MLLGIPSEPIPCIHSGARALRMSCFEKIKSIEPEARMCIHSLFWNTAIISPVKRKPPQVAVGRDTISSGDCTIYIQD